MVTVFVLELELSFDFFLPLGYITLNNFLIGNGLIVLKIYLYDSCRQDPKYSDDVVHSADQIPMRSSSLNK